MQNHLHLVLIINICSK